MNTDISSVIDRIQTDIALLRQLVAQTPDAEIAVDVPVMKANYTCKEARKAKAQIEAAFRAGVIGYDKKRGLKMRVTKATKGWSPTK